MTIFPTKATAKSMATARSVPHRYLRLVLPLKLPFKSSRVFKEISVPRSSRMTPTTNYLTTRQKPMSWHVDGCKIVCLKTADNEIKWMEWKWFHEKMKKNLFVFPQPLQILNKFHRIGILTKYQSPMRFRDILFDNLIKLENAMKRNALQICINFF